jgi:N4-(beta-N-acetylglucosaminyl)-L-asparaginase
MPQFTRRSVLGAAALAPAALSLKAQTGGKRPVIISAANGFHYLDRAWAALQGGADTLDAAIEVVRGPEEDPKDDSVGLGGLPNEEGVVELDSCCMHGPTYRAGSVGGVHNIINVSKLAKAVMEHTGHVMLVAEGAERFGYALGFPKDNLLTEHSRKVWLLWKETHSNQDWWGPGVGAPGWTAPDASPKTQAEFWQERYKAMNEIAGDLGIAPADRADAIRKVIVPPTGTINCSVLNQKGEISGITTTSGLAWKIPGRLGDSPVIGAGCYADPEVGAAGATGNGEENIKIAGAHTIVENMRHGMSPEEAGMDALKRIVRFHREDMNQIRFIGMIFYILRKDGAHASVTMWGGKDGHQRKYAVHDGTARLETCTALYQGDPVDWPPIPAIK